MAAKVLELNASDRALAYPAVKMSPLRGLKAMITLNSLTLSLAIIQAVDQATEHA